MNIYEIVESLVNDLINSGELDPYDYTGVHESEYPKPCDIVIDGMLIAEAEFIMTVKENGDYDGLEGIDIRIKI